MGTSCGQGVSIEHSMMRFFLSVVLAGAALADSEPYTIDRWPMVMAMVSLLELTMAMALSLDMELSVTVATMVAMLAMEVSITASTESVKLTVILMPTQLVRLLLDMPMVLSLELITAMALSLDMEPLVTVAMLAMEVSMVATEVTMASVRLTLMPTLLAKLPSAFLWPMPTLLAILIMLESSLEWVTPDTEVMLDMEVTIILDSMASVRLTLMPTPLARLPTASLWPMPTLQAILTMLELSPELVIPATEVMLDMEVTLDTVATLDTSTDKYLQGHCPA